MAEKRKTAANRDFILDATKHKKLLDYAARLFENPKLLAKADIVELLPDNPALASKVLLSTYTRSLLSEAKRIDSPNQEAILAELYEKYKDAQAAFIDRNKTLFKAHVSAVQKGGN